MKVLITLFFALLFVTQIATASAGDCVDLLKENSARDFRASLIAAGVGTAGGIGGLLTSGLGGIGIAGIAFAGTSYVMATRHYLRSLDETKMEKLIVDAKRGGGPTFREVYQEVQKRNRSMTPRIFRTIVLNEDDNLKLCPASGEKSVKALIAEASSIPPSAVSDVRVKDSYADTVAEMNREFAAAYRDAGPRHARAGLAKGAN